MSLGGVIRCLERNRPVIMLIQAWPDYEVNDWENEWRNGHYVVAIGYSKKLVYFADPSVINTAYLGRDELEKRWHDIDTNGKKYDHYGIAVYGRKCCYNPKDIVHID